MAKSKLSLPHERRKAVLQSAKLRSRVRIAEERERLSAINSELQAMRPKKAASADPLAGNRFRKVG